MSTAQSIIYPAQGVLTLIGHACNLFRLNWKAGMLLMVVPAAFQIILAILGSLIAGGTFLTPAPGITLILYGLVALCVAIGWFVYPFVWGACACTLSRFYYSAIIQEKPLSLRECWRHTQKNALPLGLMMLGMIFSTLFLVFISFTILIIGGVISAMGIKLLVDALSSTVNQTLTGMMTLLFLLIWGFLVLGLIIVLASVQGFFCIFPFISVATADSADASGTWAKATHGLKHVFENIPRLVPFALALFFFTWLAIMTLMTPSLVWIVLELKRLGVAQQHHIPVHISIVSNIMRGLVELLSGPFVISAVTLFWYDCQVRREGMDLRLWFNRIVGRQNQSPADYETAFSLETV